MGGWAQMWLVYSKDGPNFTAGLWNQEVTLVSATSEQSGAPASNALEYWSPRKPWKTADTSSAQQLVVSYTAAQWRLGGIYIGYTNYDKVQVEYSPDGVTYSDLSPYLTDYYAPFSYNIDGSTTPALITIPKDPRTGRRQIWISAVGRTYNDYGLDYWRITIPAGLTTDDEQEAYSTGVIAMTNAGQLYTIRLAGAYSDSWRVTTMPAVRRAQFDSGGSSERLLGTHRVRIELDATYWLNRLQAYSGGDASQNYALEWLARTRPEAVHLFIERTWASGGDPEHADPSRAYLVRMTEGGDWSFEHPLVGRTSFVFEEIT